MTVGPLVSVGWLDDHRDDPALRIADCRWYLEEPGRGRAEYERSHIPGAVFVSLDDDLSAPSGPGRHPLPAPEIYAARLGALGMGDEHTVVAYDDRGGGIAARLWWMLRAIGHTSVAVLDGGLTAWRAAGLAEESAVVTHPPAALTVSAQPRTIDRSGLESRLGNVVLIDARDGERYRGEHEPVDPVAGHIPTAVSRPTAGNLRADMRFETPETLRRRFASAGVGPAADTVVYCGSGVTACHDILAIELAGLGEATLYPGSWSDWGTSGGAIATGAEPGTR